MKRRLSIFIAFFVFIISVIVPFVVYNGNREEFLANVVKYLLYVAVGLSVLGLILAIFLYYYIGSRRSVFVAYDMTQIDFVSKLKTRLEKKRINCYTGLSDFTNGTKIHSVSIENQLRTSDLVIVIFDEKSIDSVYISVIVKISKKLNKPLQIYSQGVLETHPIFLKQYRIFPLEGSIEAKLNDVDNLINAFFIKQVPN